MANMTTDVTPILVKAFPSGKPELSASDFAKARSFVEGRRAGSIPKPGPLSMDYPWWAHTMIVDWRMRVQEYDKMRKQAHNSGLVFPASATYPPSDLRCPECEVMCVLDMTQGDVLVCPGGCHRAITVNTFVQLFKPVARNNQALGTAQRSQNQLNQLNGGMSTRRTGPVIPAQPVGPLSLDRTVPKGMRPEDYGIHEEPRKSRKPISGWRMWNLKPWEDAPHLESLSIARETSWLPMEPQRGTCNGKDPSEITDHVCPSWEHRCGVHAVKELEQVKKWGTPPVGPQSNYVRVVGKIDLWGRVLEYEEGYRAEWGYPSTLYIPSRLPELFSPMTAEQMADTLWMTYLTEVVVDQDMFDRFNAR